MPGWAMIVISFGFPLLYITLREKAGWNILHRLNPIIVCYVAGIILANTGLVGDDAAGPLDLVQTATVALSIPLLLFAVNLKKVRSLSGRVGLSMVLASASIMVTVTAAHLLFRGFIDESEKISGLVVGVYTGGTPNLGALKRALSVDENSYLTVHTADLVLSALYLLFVMTIAKKTLNRVLPAFAAPAKARAEHVGPASAAPAGEMAHAEAQKSGDAYADLLKGSSVKGMLVSLGLALAVAGLGGIVFAVVPADAPEGLGMVLTILALTTLALAASFIPFVQKQKMSYPLGQYLILVFCVSVGALADLKILLEAAPSLFLFVGFSLFGSFLLHIILARLAKIDTDTVLITSTSAICSPPFVPLTAAAINNRDLIAPGITTGILGHAFGTYLGILMAQLLSLTG